MRKAARPVERCFRRIQFESAKLDPVEGKPGGVSEVSLMFYRLLLSDSFGRRFDYMWWQGQRHSCRCRVT